MARFKTSGLDATIRQMKELGEMSGKVADRMLTAGAEEVKKAWKKAADIHGLRLTDQMRDSIGYPRKPKDVNGVRTMDIYPQGVSTYTVTKKGKRIERKKAIRNAEIAFINHYGTSRKPATHWVDTADELAEQPATDAMKAIWDEELRKRGL